MSTSFPVWGKRVLLVSGSGPEQHLRAAVFRAHALTVDVASDLRHAIRFCDEEAYSWILLDVRRFLPGETLDFCAYIRERHPGLHVAFLVGPPQYVTLDWPEASVSATAA